MTTWRRIFAAVTLSYGGFFLVYGAPACTTAEKSRDPNANLSTEEKKKLEDYAAEIEIGRNMAGRLLQFYGTQQSDDLLGYVNQVGNYVASYGDYPDRRYMFEIIDTDMVNAFACPGGYILISMGALRHAKNEAELAAVLGHETAHVGKRHMYDTLKNMSKEELDKTADEDRLARLPESMQARARPKAEESETGSLMARYLSAGTAGLNFLQAARAGMSLILEKGLGADLEYEADREGVKYAIRAGYDPDAMVDFLCRLEVKKRGLPEPKKKCSLPDATAAKKKSDDILDQTHPPIAQRMATIQEVLVSLNASEIIGATGKKRFEKYAVMMSPAKTGEK